MNDVLIPLSAGNYTRADVDAACAEIRRLRRENEKLTQDMRTAAERIAAQSELLSKRAEAVET